MDPISEIDIRRRIERDNPWWSKPNETIPEAVAPRRVYFGPFKNRCLNLKLKRAIVLVGPRRVGKTFMAKQLVHQAILDGWDPKSILYASIDAPIYSGTPLEKFLDFFPKSAKKQRLIIFDEIQYLRNWEIHLKDLVDHYPHVKFVATGSAAAALRLKSQESGAGRFSDFMLPPLTFQEFLSFSGSEDSLIKQMSPTKFDAKDLSALNSAFVDYLNYGGYPEAVTHPEVQRNPEQFIKNDIIDKVLLKDLPSLYGINEIQELNKLFSVLAYNAGTECSLEKISQSSGLAKQTITKYIEYLESAFLIIKVSTVDDNCHTMKRERNFKIYLNNPSMRSALFAPVAPTDTDRIGFLAESAIFSQWQHWPDFRQFRYARWRNEGEVDIVFLEGPKNTPAWVGEIKWSDRINDQFGHETRSIAALLRKHKSIEQAFFTTKSTGGEITVEGKKVTLYPCAVYCYTVGRNITNSLFRAVVPRSKDAPEDEAA